MAMMADFKRVLSRPRTRLLEAERRFFDAYSRGGSHDPRDLVVPIDYFAVAAVKRALEAWARGEATLNEHALEMAWRARAGPEADRTQFYRNLAHYLSLV